ncbi:MAG: hypothetical protein PHQ28_06915 [Mycobacterium sp.]|nr:hypothetical protein [Mycobacterium sp.]
MRDEIVKGLAHPLFRSAWRRRAISDVRQALDRAKDTGAFSAAELRVHWEDLHGGSVAGQDESAIVDLICSVTEPLRNAMLIAEVFVIAPAMHRAVAAAAATIDADDLATLTRDDIDWETGFLVFPRPVQLGGPGGWSDAEAITWQVTSNRAGVCMLRIHHWSRSGWKQNIPGSNPRPWPTMTQVPLDRAVQMGRSVSQEAFQSGPDPQDWAVADAVAESGPDNEYALVCESGSHAAILAYLFAFLRIAAQPMTVTPRCRDERAGVQPQKWERVRVVQLRRFHQMASIDSPHRQVNWQHSWVVRMHKVRQWYPSLGRHQVIFRGPYIKGPANAPLLAGEKVQALVR